MIYPNFKNNEILPAIIQDEKSKTILMLGYMNEEAFKKTIEDGEAIYFSRSRKYLLINSYYILSSFWVIYI